MTSDEKPSVEPMPDGPFRVKKLQRLSNRNGAIEAGAMMALCCCGGSENKPFCDGTHAKIGFSSAKVEGRLADKREDYQGEKITIHDNRSICAHAGRCTDGLPSVFRMKVDPWIDADGASAQEIIETVRQCPSGALSYSVDGVEHRDREGPPAIFVSPNGPYVVTGGPQFLGMPLGEGGSADQVTLCRCGGSKNKPFCDGSYWSNDFSDNKN